MLNIKTQFGFATVLFSVLILAILSVITTVSSKVSISEQRVSANEARTNQAFNAADAGIDAGLSHLQNYADAIIVDGDSDGFIDSYTHADITNVVLSNNSRYTITYSNPTAGDFNVVEITATSFNDDSTSTRVLKQKVMLDITIVSSPVSTLTARGIVDISGNLEISNTESDITIWSGGSAELSGSAKTVISNDSSSSDSSGNGRDVYDTDSHLSSVSESDFFKLFFTSSPEQIQRSANIQLAGTGTDNYSSQLDGKGGVSIWVDQSAGTAKLNANVVIGSPTKPVILFVDGDMHMNGGVKIYGLVYVTGELTTTGNSDIYGAMISQNSVTGSGTPNIHFDSAVLNNLDSVGTYTKVPGSWRDF